MLADLHCLLKDLKPHGFYETEEAPKWHTIVIIDNPLQTMGHALLDFDVLAAKQSAMQACEATERDKPLLALVRGMGGGKTRTIVELWLALNDSPNVLALAITFNSKWMVDSWECDFIDESAKRSDLVNACCVRMIISRMASVFFGWDFHAAKRQLDQKSILDAAKTDPQGLLRAFVAYLVSRVNRKITHFVLLIDETAAMEKAIVNRFGVVDATWVLRTGLLDTPIYKADTQDVLHVGLVMSSLELSPIGQTLSRAVLPLELPLELSPEKIVATWWNQPSPSVVVRLAASLFASMPRVVQIAASLIPNAKSFERLLQEVCQGLYQRYGKMRLPSAHFLRAVVLREEIALGKDAMSLIQQSMFVNALENFREDAVIVPEANLLMLVAAAKNGSASVEKDLLLNMLQLDVQQPEDVLEVLLYRWMNFRFAFLHQLDKEVGLATLLQVCAYKSVLSLDQVPVVPSHDFIANLFEPKRLQHSSRLSPDECAAEIVGLSGKGAVQMHLSQKDDAFDLLLVFGKCLLFFDAKSCDEKQDTSSSSNSTTTTKRWNARAECVREFMGAHSWAGFSGWFYISFAMHDVPPSNQEHVITLGRNNVKEFFGPLWPCYRVFRAEWNNPTEMNL